MGKIEKSKNFQMNRKTKVMENDDMRKATSVNRAYGQLCIAIINSAIKDGDFKFFENDWGELIVDCANSVMPLSIYTLRDMAKMQHDNLLIETPNIFTM